MSARTTKNRGAALDIIPFAKIHEAAPKEDWEPDHEESVCPQIGSDGKIAVEGRRSYLRLEVGEVGSLPSHQREQVLSQDIPPFWKRSFICHISQRTRLPSMRSQPASDVEIRRWEEEAIWAARSDRGGDEGVFRGGGGETKGSSLREVTSTFSSSYFSTIPGLWERKLCTDRIPILYTNAQGNVQ